MTCQTQYSFPVYVVPKIITVIRQKCVLISLSHRLHVNAGLRTVKQHGRDDLLSVCVSDWELKGSLCRRCASSKQQEHLILKDPALISLCK